MKCLIPFLVSVLGSGLLLSFCASDARTKQQIVFATFAEDRAALTNALLVAESIRTFGGSYRSAPIRVYVPQLLRDDMSQFLDRLASLKVGVRTSAAPEDAAWFYFSAKVYAAGRAEAEAESETALLAWLDEDTIVLQEPAEFILPQAKALGYRPVMHRNVGLLYDGPVDAFWRRAYDLLSVPEASAFPMVTPADGDTIRAYFNAGCMIVRPERGLLRKWGDCFAVLYRDSLLAQMCREDVKKRIFIHQVALTGAILMHLGRDEMVELSGRINYSIFFEQMFEAKRTFDDISDVVTFRHESYFGNPAPDWDKKLKGPADRIAWMKARLGKKKSE